MTQAEQQSKHTRHVEVVPVPACHAAACSLGSAITHVIITAL